MMRATHGLSRSRILVLAGLFVAHAAALIVQQAERRAVAGDVRGLDVELAVSGRSTSLGEIAKDRPLLLVFWTSWCTYCIEHLEGGAGLVDALSAGPAPVAVAFVNVREHPWVVSGYPAVSGVTDHVVLDRSGTLARSLRVSAFPTYVLVNRRGRPIWSQRGLAGSIVEEVASRVRAESS